MSNAAIQIRWGRPTVGRETKGLEVFSQAIEYYATLEKQKKIDAYRVYLATNGAVHELSGCVILEGDVAQLRAVLDSDDYKSLFYKAGQVVDGLEVVHMAMGDEIQKLIMQVVAARKAIGITT